MKQPFFFRSSVQKWCSRLVVILCVVSLLLEFTMHRHSHFAESGFYSMDGIFGFYGILGFIGCAIIMIITSIVSAFAKVGEGYYENDF